MMISLWVDRINMKWKNRNIGRPIENGQRFELWINNPNNKKAQMYNIVIIKWHVNVNVNFESTFGQFKGLQMNGWLDSC